MATFSHYCSLTVKKLCDQSNFQAAVNGLYDGHSFILKTALRNNSERCLNDGSSHKVLPFSPCEINIFSCYFRLSYSLENVEFWANQLIDCSIGGNFICCLIMTKCETPISHNSSCVTINNPGINLDDNKRFVDLGTWRIYCHSWPSRSQGAIIQRSTVRRRNDVMKDEKWKMTPQPQPPAVNLKSPTIWHFALKSGSWICQKNLSKTPGNSCVERRSNLQLQMNYKRSFVKCFALKRRSACIT